MGLEPARRVLYKQIQANTGSRHTRTRPAHPMCVYLRYDFQAGAATRKAIVLFFTRLCNLSIVPPSLFPYHFRSPERDLYSFFRDHRGPVIFPSNRLRNVRRPPATHFDRSQSPSIPVRGREKMLPPRSQVVNVGSAMRSVSSRPADGGKRKPLSEQLSRTKKAAVRRNDENWKR